MAEIYNKVNKILMLGLMLCLVALLPLSALADNVEYYGTYGIGISWDHDTWHERYYAEEGLDRTVAGFQGSGTLEAPYLISTVWDLCRLEDLVNAGNSFTDQYFRLEQDLDLGGEVYNPEESAPLWYPIGVNVSFLGNFDGGGHTIDYMRILIGDRKGDEHYAYGLFGYSKGVIRNLKMTHASIKVYQSPTYNEATYLAAGLLCGYLWQDEHGNNRYGAVYGCDLQGRLSGGVYNKSGYHYSVFVGGLVGLLHIPTSVYQCHVNLETDLTNVAHVGGIAGAIKADGVMYPIENDTENSLSKPRATYVFDCTADVSGSSEGNFGGICGFNEYGNIVACATSGSLTGYGSTGGGIVGLNYSTVINCVSLMTLNSSQGVKLGGIIGFNDNARGIENHTTKDLNVFNCVYSGHLNGRVSPTAYGLVGAGKAFTNALFLGTMEKNENCASLNPLWNSTDDVKAYSDANLFDGGGNFSCYKNFSKITSGESNETEFTTKANYHRWWPNNRNGDDTEITIDNVWRYRQGFYPRLQVGSANITNGTTDALLKLHDYVIELAAEKFGDDKAALTTPKLFPQYAWLASVPAFTHDGQWAYFFDTSMSLAHREMTDDQSNVLSANYAVANYYPNDPALMSVADNTATPKVNVEGDVWVTITSPNGASKKLLLNVNGQRKWDGELAANFDGGNGTSDSPYLIHDARQLILAFAVNLKDQYYKLVGDIWLNENLLTNTGEPKTERSEWDHQGKRDENNWKAHLDGNGHLVRGLFSKNAFGLLEKINNGASIQNTGFVDCLVWSPETEQKEQYGYNNPFSFLTPAIGATAAVRNCLFDGVIKERRQDTWSVNFGTFIHTIDNSDQQIGDNPVIEDCVVSIVALSDISGITPEHAFLSYTSGQYTPNIAARRVLVLNNSMATSNLTPSGIKLEHCHYAKGYLPLYQYDQEDAANSKLVTDMTNGTFFTDDGFDKWTAKEERFPMLTTFAETSYGKLLTLPVFTDKDNRLDNMNYLLDFTPGNATWQVTNGDAIAIDTDIRVLEPKAANSSTFLVRSMDGAKMITPIKTAAEIKTGIEFEDPEAKAFCVAHYDDDNNGEISLSELKTVTLSQFQDDMNENDNNPNDNDGELITLFPEFRYFAGISDLGTSFRDKENLQKVRLSGKITELSDDDFIGNTSMTSFTIPTSVTTVSGQAFNNAGLENYEVEVDHSTFAAVDGLLLNKDKDQLLSYPSGRKGTSVDVPNNVTSIAAHAIYKMTKVDTVFIHTADYTTVVSLANDGIVHASDNDANMIYYVEDATNDDAKKSDEARSFMPKRRTSSETGLGNGHLIGLYKANSQWQDKAARIKPFFTLKVSENSKDNQDRYWATMYIGFDTKLPEGLTAYTADTTNNKMVLHKIGREVPMLTPVVILAEKAGDYKLLGSEEAKYAELPMSENKLNGVGRDSMTVNQSSANEGGCLTLGKNRSGQVGFFIYKGKSKVPAFRAYLTVNTVSEAREMLMSFDDEDTNGIGDAARLNNKEQSTKGDLYNLNGQRVSQPGKGIYISNGRKFIKK